MSSSGRSGATCTVLALVVTALAVFYWGESGVSLSTAGTGVNLRYGLHFFSLRS